MLYWHGLTQEFRKTMTGAITMATLDVIGMSHIEQKASNVRLQRHLCTYKEVSGRECDMIAEMFGVEGAMASNHLYCTAGMICLGRPATHMLRSLGSGWYVLTPHTLGPKMGD